jgi:hypothetical protein
MKHVKIRIAKQFPTPKFADIAKLVDMKTFMSNW